MVVIEWKIKTGKKHKCDIDANAEKSLFLVPIFVLFFEGTLDGVAADERK